MSGQKKETKTLVVLTNDEKEKAEKISVKVLGKSNYSGLYAWFINNYKLED